MTFGEMREAVNKLCKSPLDEPYLYHFASGRIQIDGTVDAAQLQIITAWLAQKEDAASD